MKSRILVTGSTGFVGKGLLRRLIDDGNEIRAIVRHKDEFVESLNIEVIYIDELTPELDWSQALSGVSCVIHLAARVHVLKDDTSDPLAAFERTNVHSTLNLARQAADAGVTRFVFLSSIKVNGEKTASPRNGSVSNIRSVFTEADEPSPEDPYAVSKFMAEQGLLKLSRQTNMDVVIIRPPLVYGPGVKANFLKMLSWLDKELPLPLGSVCNARSLVFLDNLVDFIVTCMNHPMAANEIFLVSDGEDISTTQLLRRTASALGKTPRLLPVPQAMLTVALKLLGKDGLAQRLCGSLRVDISKARDLLSWSPPLSVDYGLKSVADWYRQQGHS